MLEKDVLRKEMENAVNWIRDYVKSSGARGIVVGNSGGKDSAVVIAMAEKAIGKENVLAVSMPCFSSSDDLEDAKLVAKKFDIRLLVVDLSSSYKKMESVIELNLGQNLSKEACINMKPRLRMTTLYGIARKLRIFSNWYR